MSRDLPHDVWQRVHELERRAYVEGHTAMAAALRLVVNTGDAAAARADLLIVHHAVVAPVLSHVLEC